MTETYIDEQYVYAVARIRGAELKLMNSQAMTELIAAPNVAGVVSLLKEKGWGSDEASTGEALMATERMRLWELVDELVPDPEIFRVFRVQNDYHNLKAAIKAANLNYDYPGIYIDQAEVAPEIMAQAIAERNYGALPDNMAELAMEAQDTFLRTGDGQLCDIIVDRAALEAILEAGRASGDDFISMYAELVVASADIKIAVRCALTGKDADFIDRALADCDSLDRKGLISAAVNGTDAICSFLSTTDYADAVPELKTGVTAFEKWCDNLIIRRMQPQLWVSFGPGPVAAYILAKENEIKSVRIILAAKENGFSEDMIRERVRETYV